MKTTDFSNKMVVLFWMLLLALPFARAQEGAPAAPAAPEDPLAAIGRQIEIVRARLSQCDRDNPHVYYNDADNPTMNISRGLRDVHINRAFYCPYHRGYRYTDKGTCGWVDATFHQQRYMSRRELAGCPAVSNNINGYPVWAAYAAQVPQTQAMDERRAQLMEELQELTRRRSAVALARDLSDKANEARDPNAETENMVVIRIPRQKVYELYSNRSTCHNGYKLILE